MLNACTIIARNYLPYARVLAESFFAHHPQGSFTILVIDDEERDLATGDDRITWKRLGDLGLEPAEIRRLAGIYDVTELATAVKPRLLRHLLDERRSEVVYLDPDICIYSSLDEVALLARQYAVVLTPHTTEPFPRDDRDVDGFFILAAGVYNLGFVAVGPSSRPFLDWWWESTRREALSDVARMMFTDQRVLDFAPAFFDPWILKDPGYNVAYWNLHGRHLTADGPACCVNGVPLRFFHFSGFDIHRPWLLSRNQGARPRILLSDRPAVRALCRDYAVRVSSAGGQSDAQPYGWGRLPSGTAITTRMRRLYWKALLAAERHGAAEPPNPFDPVDPDAFVAWLNAPEPGGPRALSRYLYSVYLDRADLQVHFRDIHGADAARFLDWLWHTGIAPETLPLELLPAAAPPQARVDSAGTPEHIPGVNLACDVGLDARLAEAVCRLTIAMDAAGIPFSITPDNLTRGPQSHPLNAGVTYDVNIVCTDAGRAPHGLYDMPQSFRAGGYTIGYWFWDVGALPPGMEPAFDAVDEIWTATDFVAEAVRNVSRKPVFTMPLPVPVPTSPVAAPRARDRAEERFTFLLVCDLLGVFDRLNPMGAIEAFTRAFTRDEGPVLVLRTIHGHLRLNDLERLRAAAEDRPDIRVVDGDLSEDEKDALLAACDCHVSLHRSDGLALTLAEAMVLGTPVIATAYSGNRQFMTAENSFLVSYSLVPIPPDCHPYPESATWADPDLDHAARLMREVFDRPVDAAVRARRGQADVLTHHGVPTAAAAVSGRLQQIRRDRVSRVAAPEVVVPKEIPMSLHSPPPAGTAVSEPVEALIPQLESLATPRVSSEGRSFAGLRLAAQRLLFRVLRPYWFQQYQFHKYLIAAFGRVATAMRYEQVQREALDARVRDLTGELVKCRQELRRLESAVADLGDGARGDAARKRR
jgi:glycosyltransferase involved in cell wall biosynthesis